MTRYESAGTWTEDAMAELHSYHADLACALGQAASNPAPAVTKDTVVTLGMLRELDARGAALAGQRPCSNLTLALGEKLAGK